MATRTVPADCATMAAAAAASRPGDVIVVAAGYTGDEIVAVDSVTVPDGGCLGI